MFIITLPFTGLSAISRHISAAGLLLTLAFLQLILMAIVRDPQKASLPWTGPLRCLIKTALLVAPAVCVRRRLGVMAAGRSVRLDCRPLAGRAGGAAGVTGVVAGVFCGLVWRNGQNPLVLQGKVNLAVSLLVLVILVLL